MARFCSACGQEATLVVSDLEDPVDLIHVREDGALHRLSGDAGVVTPIFCDLPAEDVRNDVDMRLMALPDGAVRPWPDDGPRISFGFTMQGWANLASLAQPEPETSPGVPARFVTVVDLQVWFTTADAHETTLGIGIGVC